MNSFFEALYNWSPFLSRYATVLPQAAFEVLALERPTPLNNHPQLDRATGPWETALCAVAAYSTVSPELRTKLDYFRWFLTDLYGAIPAPIRPEIPISKRKAMNSN